MQKNNCKIFVDGDACPVVEEIINIAKKHSIDVIFVTSYAHVRREELPSFVNHVIVDQDKEAADLKIANNMKYNDIAITDDLGLSSLLLAKGGHILTSRGKLITNQEIDYLLDSRHRSAKLRRSGGKTRGPKKLTEEDRIVFKKQLEKILSDMQEF